MWKRNESCKYLGEKLPGSADKYYVVILECQEKMYKIKKRVTVQ